MNQERYLFPSVWTRGVRFGRTLRQSAAVLQLLLYGDRSGCITCEMGDNLRGTVLYMIYSTWPGFRPVRNVLLRCQQIYNTVVVRELAQGC